MILRREVSDILTEMTTVRPSSNIKLQTELCPQCSKKGILSNLKLCQINFNEAMYLCTHEKCEFPTLSENLQSYIIKRPSSCLLDNKNKVDEKQHLPEPEKTVQTSQNDKNNDIDFGIEDLFGENITNDSTNMGDFSEFFLDEIFGMSESEDSMLSEDNETVKKQEILQSKSPSITTEVNAQNKSPVNVPVQPTSSISSHVPAVVLQDTEDVNNNSETLKKTEDKNIDVADVEFEPMDVDNVSNDVADPNDEEISDHECVIIPQEEILTLNEINENLKKPVRNVKILQWTNENNLCWLDVILLVVTNSVNLRSCFNLSSHSNIFKEICHTYDRCQTLHEADRVKANHKMSTVREKLFRTLQSKSTLKKGEHESPVELLPNIINLSKDLCNVCTTKVRWEFECEHCQHKRARRANVTVVSFPNTNVDFHPLNAEFTRPCFKCKAEEQTMSLQLESLPPCLIFHFQNGMPHSKFKAWDFVMESRTYSVYAVIQYKTKPYKHFILWLRDCKSNKWIMFDDLESEICEWQTKPPKIPKNEIHIVMWERQGISQPESASLSDLELVENEEACSAGSSIPKEVFEAHLADETVEITSEVDLNESQPIENVSNETSFSDPEYDELPDIETNDSMHSQDINQTNLDANSTEELVPQPLYIPEGQLPINSFYANPGVDDNLSKMVSIVPEQNGQTTVQVYAPANTSRVVIVTNPHAQNPNQLTPFASNRFDVQFTPYHPVVKQEEKPVSFSDLGKRHRSREMSQFLDSSMTPYLPKRQYKLRGYKIKKEKKTSAESQLLPKWSSSRDKK